MKVPAKPPAVPVKKAAVTPVAKSLAKPVMKVAVKKAAAELGSAGKVVKSALEASSKAITKPNAVHGTSVVNPPKSVAKTATKAAPAKEVNAAAKKVAQAPVKTAKLDKVTMLAAKPASRAVKPVNAGVVQASTQKPTPLAAPVAASVRPTEKSMLIPAPPALKPGRRSSARAHAQMPPPAPMVPTHAPDAAKASYSTITERVIAPPPHVAAKKDPKLANNWKTTAADTLTDEEVKAMPDAEYMNEKQMAFFRHKLSILKQEIHNSAGETTEHLREDTVVVPDPADRATIEEEHALELRTRDRERKLLKKIEQSIARIDSGDYGYCDETGEPIGVGRLIARPTANLSLEAQQRRELKQKMFGD